MNHLPQEIDVPPFFLCPISLQIMKDPVTIPTGITYDRDAIETWIYTNKNTTCPVTKQALNVDTTDSFVTPNHTLRRLIQSWCTFNASHGIERFPTPKPLPTKPQILKLINEALSSSPSTPSKLIKCLNKIKSFASESNASKRCLETTPQVFEFLFRVFILADHYTNNTILSCGVSDEALRLIAQLNVSDEVILKKILDENEGPLFDSLVKIMQKGTYESRAYAIQILRKLVHVADPTHINFLKREHFIEIIQLIKNEVSPRAIKDALKALALVCPVGRNKIRVVEAGAVHVVVDLLIETNDRRINEMGLVVLDQLSGCAEGRAELLSHGAGLAVVSKKILRVSHFATDKGVKILYALAKFYGTTSVVQEMLQLGVVIKLCLVLQVDCEVKTKEKAREILKLHARSWRNSPCAPSHVFGSFN